MNLTQPTERFDTLAEAEDTLKHQGFKVVPDTCNWIDEAGRIDAGVYAVDEDAYGVCKYRIEYRALKGAPTHTPGPWAVFHDHPTAKSLAHIRPVNQPDDFFCGEIASVYCCGDEAPYQKANACLIAAAPDMLALLQELIDIEGPQPGTSEWANKVRATIAKATEKAASQ